MAERLRVVLEFNKNRLDDLELYQLLQKFSSPPNLIKDILKGIIPLEILNKNQEDN